MPRRKRTEGMADGEILGPTTVPQEAMTRAQFINEVIIPELEKRKLIINMGDKPYVMADGRLYALHMLYPNPIELSVVDVVEADTQTHFVTATTIKLVYEEGGVRHSKEARGISGISKKSLDDYAKSSPFETCSTSSLGRALKNLGILSEWGATVDEIDKARTEKQADLTVATRVSDMDTGVSATNKVEFREATEQQRKIVEALGKRHDIQQDIIDKWLSGLDYKRAGSIIMVLQSKKTPEAIDIIENGKFAEEVQ